MMAYLEIEESAEYSTTDRYQIKQDRQTCEPQLKNFLASSDIPMPAVVTIKRKTCAL
jgi:hypothetical protein